MEERIKEIEKMDNRKITIKAEGKESFDLAMQLAFKTHNKAKGYLVQDNTLVFYWCDYDKAVKLPFEMKVQDAINFAWAWLENTPPSTGEPDHDGDNYKGFMVYNDSWGHVFNAYQAIIGITPIWAMYGK